MDWRSRLTVQNQPSGDQGTVITGLLYALRGNGRIGMTIGDELTLLLASVPFASSTEGVADRINHVDAIASLNVLSDCRFQSGLGRYRKISGVK